MTPIIITFRMPLLVMMNMQHLCSLVFLPALTKCSSCFWLFNLLKYKKTSKDQDKFTSYMNLKQARGWWVLSFYCTPVSTYLPHSSCHFSIWIIFKKKKRAQKHLSLLGRDGHEIEITQGLDDTRPPEMVWNPSFLTKEIDISVFKQTPTPFMSRPLRYKKQL